jgi:hypothetical protein
VKVLLGTPIARAHSTHFKRRLFRNNSLHVGELFSRNESVVDTEIFPFRGLCTVVIGHMKGVNTIAAVELVSVEVEQTVLALTL